MLKQTIILLVLFFCQYTSVAQAVVFWRAANNTNTLNGYLPGLIVDVIQEGDGNNVTFSSPFPSQDLIGMADSQHFTTFGQPRRTPSKKITFNFSTPVIITRLNIGDINLSSEHDDSFVLQGVRFTTVNAVGSNATINSATATGNNASNVIWHMSTTAISSFSIVYSTTNSKTHSFITYALEVMLEGSNDDGGGGGGGTTPIDFCPGASYELTALNQNNPDYTYEWIVPGNVPNPGNVRTFTTTQPGAYTVLITNIITGQTLPYQIWNLQHLPLFPLTFSNLPTSICPDKQTLNAPLPTVSRQGINGVWAQTSLGQNSVTYTFTPDTGLCAAPYTHIVPIVATVPYFATPNAVCNLNDVNLPLVSQNNISGSWVLVTSTAQDGTYRFIPGPNQCASETQIKVPISPKVVPYFDITNPSCINSNFTFPEISVNDISGKWTLISEDTDKFIYEFEPTDLNCNEKITIDIFKLKLPEFNIPQSICELSEISLPTTSINGYEGNWEQIQKTQNSAEYLFTPFDFCVATVNISINIITKTTPEFDQITVNCKFDEEQLPTTSKNGISGNWKLSNENGKLLTYTFIPIDGQCATRSTMEIVDASILKLNFEPQCINDKLYLKAYLFDGNQVVKIDSYEYSYNDNLVSEQDKLNVTDLNIHEGDLPITINLKVTQDNGCEFFNTIQINHTDCAIPKGISPGSDNINDVLDLKNFKVKKLSIFNRYGRIVYEKHNYKNEWGGQNNNGHLLPSGTYFYQIDFANETASKTGWIYLNTPK